MSCVKTLPLLLGLSAFLLGTGAWALPEDRNQPIRVQADTAELDDRQGVAVYRGDVVITQGSMKITGDTVTITQSASGDVDVFTSIGKPAYYEQKPSADKQVVKAYGLTIQYFASNERIVLIDQAKVVQEGNTFEGEKIVYDTQRQIVNAGRATDTNVTTPRPRVDMVIQPRNRDTPAAEQSE
jgi:lipopolysaccharide export system protein LptA